MAKSCADSSDNSFIASGRGGLPTTPGDRLIFNAPWEDLRAIATNSRSQHRISQSAAEQSLLSEANSWQLDESGQVVLNSTDRAKYSATAGCLAQKQPS